MKLNEQFETQLENVIKIKKMHNSDREICNIAHVLYQSKMFDTMKYVLNVALFFIFNSC